MDQAIRLYRVSFPFYFKANVIRTRKSGTIYYSTNIIGDELLLNFDAKFQR